MSGRLQSLCGVAGLCDTSELNKRSNHPENLLSEGSPSENIGLKTYRGSPLEDSCNKDASAGAYFNVGKDSRGIPSVTGFCTQAAYHQKQEPLNVGSISGLHGVCMLLELHEGAQQTTALFPATFLRCLGS